MRKLILLALAAVAGAVIYATAAPAGQEASPSRAEFNALKHRMTVVEKNSNTALVLLGSCLTHAVPISRYDGYVSLDASGNPFQTTALDVTDEAGVAPQTYLLDVGQVCANAIASAGSTRHLSLARPRALTRAQH